MTECKNIYFICFLAPTAVARTIVADRTKDITVRDKKQIKSFFFYLFILHSIISDAVQKEMSVWSGNTSHCLPIIRKSHVRTKLPVLQEYKEANKETFVLNINE